MWPRLVENPSYTQYWRDCAADRWFDHPSRTVPALTVHGLWDQEDIYGAPAAYAALERLDPANDHNFFAAGPWYHGQHFADGSRLGALTFDEDTARRFRQDVLTPFLRRFLKGERRACAAAGHRLRDRERTGGGSSIAGRLRPRPGGSTCSRAERSGSRRRAPEHPSASTSRTRPGRCRMRPRPHWGFDYDNPVSIAAWRRWLVEDQRFVDGRPDVATWTGAPLETPVTVRGPVTVHLVAETTGTDADWVVKLIDFYPDEDVPPYEMSGFELMVSADIFRGRYRESLEEARPIAANRPLAYTMALPHVNHTFRRGHRLMVQVQSTWFPLYDRNPQTFVPSIMTAPASAYTAQRHRIHHGGEHVTYVEVGTETQETDRR